MAKTIFFQDIQKSREFKNQMLGYWTRDKLISIINSLIKKIEKDRDNTYKLKKKNLCKEEKEKIERHIEEILIDLTNKKIFLKELQNKIRKQGDKVDFEKEMNNILNATPINYQKI